MKPETSTVYPPYLHIQLLGNFRIDYRGESLTGIVSAHLQSLLVYLLLHRGVPQSRQHLAFLFWPDSSEAQARTNFRHLLHNLRAGSGRR
jgi:DNA-binding SARP family transcriptional activator